MTSKELESKINSILRSKETTFNVSGVLCDGASFDNVGLKVNASEYSNDNAAFEEYRTALLSYYKASSVGDAIKETIFNDGKLNITREAFENFKTALRNIKLAKKNGLPIKQFINCVPTRESLEFSGKIAGDAEGSELYFVARPNDNGEATLGSKGSTTITRMSYVDQSGAEVVLFESPVHSMREELKPKMRINNVESMGDYALNYMENDQIIDNPDSKCRDLAARLGIRMVLAAEASPLLEDFAMKPLTLETVGSNGVTIMNGFYNGVTTGEYTNGAIFTNNFIPLEAVKSVKANGVEIPEYSPTKTAVDTYNSLFQNNELTTPREILEFARKKALEKAGYSDPQR